MTKRPGTIRKLADRMGRANVANPEAHELLVRAILGERDRLDPFDHDLAACLHAAALLMRTLPKLAPDVSSEVRSLATQVVERISGAADALVDPTGRRGRAASDGAVPSSEELGLGDLMVELGVVAETDVKEALAHAHRSGRRLGDALVALGRANVEDIENALSLQALLRRKGTEDATTSAPDAAPETGELPSTSLTAAGALLLGEILLRSGKIEREQLDDALELHRSIGLRLGEALIRLGAATPRDVARALAQQPSNPSS